VSDLLALAAFMGIAVTFDYLEKYIEHIPEVHQAMRVLKHGCMAAPWLLHGTRDFAIHLLVYSGAH